MVRYYAIPGVYLSHKRIPQKQSLLVNISKKKF